jgi:hypothetical protein
MPTKVTCFTDRRSPRARERNTPVGRLEFVCVRSEVYAPPSELAMATAAQALCDFVYLSRRQGVRPESLLHFRHLDRLSAEELRIVLARYPGTVRRHVERLCDSR